MNEKLVAKEKNEKMIVYRYFKIFRNNCHRINQRKSFYMCLVVRLVGTTISEI